MNNLISTTYVLSIPPGGYLTDKEMNLVALLVVEKEHGS